MVAIFLTNIMFALDLIPAIFGLTQDPYIVFTANAFALMGLRQMFFLLDGLLDRLIYLSLGLAVILGFIGVKLIINAAHENELLSRRGGVAGVEARASRPHPGSGRSGAPCGPPGAPSGPGRSPRADPLRRQRCRRRPRPGWPSRSGAPGGGALGPGGQSFGAVQRAPLNAMSAMTSAEVTWLSMAMPATRELSQLTEAVNRMIQAWVSSIPAAIAPLRYSDIGNGAEAWVLLVEADPALSALAQRAVLSAKHLVAHNASFDAVVLDATGIAPLEVTYPKVVDTLTLSRLADPLGAPVRRGPKLMPGTPSRTSPASTSPRRWTPNRPSRPSYGG